MSHKRPVDLTVWTKSVVTTDVGVPAENASQIMNAQKEGVSAKELSVTEPVAKKGVFA